ncbi:hypothetical protein J5U18_08235 [Sphingobacteriaceae bacterium WQ 2009]|uniref:Uncharacterized protein n=1 Tax=Rhinopithecimicrobium faecis TaxID=2820698 RepID=A0A8T4HDV9_9SPHI|nr:hypothetical protein [Sphingobacteriaceae bacterium WQ 2009]
MDAKIQKAVEAGLKTYARIDNLQVEPLLSTIATAFDAEASYLEKVDLLDQAFDDAPQFEELREVFFDLLLINFFAEDVVKLEDDYLESEEWEQIEDQTIDRGTELLNIFLYLRECKDDEITPDLEDYLKEFLLVEEDEFQDEHEIYEDVIANQILVDSPYAEIAKVAATIDETKDLAEYFYVIMSYFSEINPSDAQFEEFEAASANKALDASVYQIITNYGN